MENVDKERLLVDMFNWADGYRVQNYDNMAIDHYKQYLAYREKVCDGNIIQDDGSKTRSNLFIPRTYEQLDAWRARLVKSFFSARPYVDFIPMPRYDLNKPLLEGNDIKAKVAASEIDMQLEKNKIVQKYYDFITSVGIFPAGIMGVGWKKLERKVTRRLPDLNLLSIVGSFLQRKAPLLRSQEVDEIVWDDNEIEVIDYFNFWPDPRGKNSDVDTWRFCFQGEYLTIDQFEEKINWVFEMGLGQKYDYDIRELLAGSGAVNDGRDERQGEVNISSQTLDGFTDEKRNMISLLHFYNGEEYGIIANKKKLVYYGKTPYQRHKKIPFIIQSFEPLPNEVYGRSLCYWLYNLQEELNTIRNQRMDNVSLILNKVIVTRGEDKDDELVMQPGAIWHEDFEGQHRWMDVPDVTGSAYQEEQILKSDMENTVGTPAVTRGVSPTGNQTATEIVTQNGNASIRFDIKIQLYEDRIKRLFELMDMNNQQFITKERAVYFYGETGANAWKVATPYDYQGEWDYRPTGANIDPAANKEIRRMQFLQLIETGKKLGLPYDYNKMSRDLLGTFDFRNPSAYMMSPEEMQQQQQSAMGQQIEVSRMQHQQEMEKIQAENQGRQNQEVIRGLAGVVQSRMQNESKEGGSGGETTTNE